MAKATIYYSCGHTGSIIERNRATADRSAKRLGENMCFTCQCAEETAAAKEAAQASGLPELTGSEKQIAYGESMRSRKIPVLQKAYDEFMRRSQKPSDKACPEMIAELCDAVNAVFAEAMAETGSKFWIEEALDAQWILNEIRRRNLAPTFQQPGSSNG